MFINNLLSYQELSYFQQQFARVVQDVERIREQQGISGKEIEGLCEGLMQRAFTGELAT
jgi:hypothetical protein